jgi:branched-chain amino acid transport system permease protein
MGELLFQQVVNGILVGSCYALASVGLTMIFGVLRAINFAHGEYFMFGAFASYTCMQYLGISYLISIPVTLAASVILGLVVSKLVMEPMADAPFYRAVLATLAVYLILQNLVFLVFGGTFRTFPAGWVNVVEVLGVSVMKQRIILILVMIAVFLFLESMIRYTRIGKAIRAVSQNREACMVVGINIAGITRFTFCLGIALASLAGVLMSPILVVIFPFMGEGMTFKAFAVTVIAGMGNVRGVILSSMFVGIMESFVTGFIGAQYREAVGFVALIAVLMWRPYGLFTLRGRF